MDSGKRIISGTWGEIWLDNEYVSECYGAQIKSSFNKESVQICGQMEEDSKITSIKNTGSLRMYKVSSRMAIKIGTAIREGRDLRFTVISKLADPDSYGSERIVVSNVSFDDLTLADWEVGVTGKIEAPFTFVKYDFLDTVEAR